MEHQKRKDRRKFFLIPSIFDSTFSKALLFLSFLMVHQTAAGAKSQNTFFLLLLNNDHPCINSIFARYNLQGYVLVRTTKKKDTSEEEVPAAASTPSKIAGAGTASVVEKTSAPAIMEPAKLREPIPENQQRELFKWILEEKRKIKTKDPLEKKRIDEEKAIIKQFLRAKSIPPL